VGRVLGGGRDLDIFSLGGETTLFAKPAECRTPKITDPPDAHLHPILALNRSGAHVYDVIVTHDLMLGQVQRRTDKRRLGGLTIDRPRTSVIVVFWIIVTSPYVNITMTNRLVVYVDRLLATRSKLSFMYLYLLLLHRELGGRRLICIYLIVQLLFPACLFPHLYNTGDVVVRSMFLVVKTGNV
jgi:hypothetical protein